METINEKKAYEPPIITIVTFETEEILGTSGFFGEEDDLTRSVRINTQTDTTVQNQVNPT